MQIALYGLMRTHSKIIQDATVARVRSVLRDANLPVSEATVRSWMRRPTKDGSIPGAYWKALAAARVATLTELATWADALAQARPEAAA